MNIVRSNLTQYKDVDAVSISSEEMEAIILPNYGGKIASFKSLKNGKEFLFQNNGLCYKKPEYGSSFIKGECSGFDDIVPSMLEYFYEKEPWKGILLPDHGEIWALPWSCKIKDSSVALTVQGVRLPYQLYKKIYFKEKNRLRIEYELRNLSPFPLDCIWSAHIMLNAEDGSRIKVPSEMRLCKVTMSDDSEIGCWGEEFQFPIIQKNNESMIDAGLYRGSQANSVLKYFFTSKMTEGWASLDFPDGSRFVVTFPNEKIPYLACVKAEEGSLGFCSVLIEPATAPYDRPDLAALHGVSCSVAPNGFFEWWIECSFEY